MVSLVKGLARTIIRTTELYKKIKEPLAEIIIKTICFMLNMY